MPLFKRKVEEKAPEDDLEEVYKAVGMTKEEVESTVMDESQAACSHNAVDFATAFYAGGDDDDLDTL